MDKEVLKKKGKKFLKAFIGTFVFLILSGDGSEALLLGIIIYLYLNIKEKY